MNNPASAFDPSVVPQGGRLKVENSKKSGQEKTRRPSLRRVAIARFRKRSIETTLVVAERG